MRHETEQTSATRTFPLGRVVASIRDAAAAYGTREPALLRRLAPVSAYPECESRIDLPARWVQFAAFLACLYLPESGRARVMSEALKFSERPGADAAWRVMDAINVSSDEAGFGAGAGPLSPRAQPLAAHASSSLAAAAGAVVLAAQSLGHCGDVDAEDEEARYGGVVDYLVTAAGAGRIDDALDVISSDVAEACGASS